MVEIHSFMQFWQALQSKIDRPMKKFCNKKHGEYGNIFEMEKVFSEELSEEAKADQK